MDWGRGLPSSFFFGVLVLLLFVQAKQSQLILGDELEDEDEKIATTTSSSPSSIIIPTTTTTTTTIKKPLKGKAAKIATQRLTRKQETCGLDESLWPSKEEEKELFKFSCVSSLCGGLGDVLRGMVSVTLFSLCTGEHFLAIQSERPPFQDYYDFPPSLKPGKTPTKQKKRLIDSAAERLMRTIERTKELPFSKEQSYTFHTNGNFLPSLLQIEETREVVREIFGSLDPEIVRGCVLRYLLKPKPFLVLLAADYFQVDGIIIGIHIRSGDGNDYSRTPIRDIKKFLKCFKEHISELKERPFLFLTADKQEMIDLVEKEFPSSQLIVSKEGKGHTDHCRRDCRDVHTSSLVDHFLLSRCDSLILSRSGFSESAAMLGGHHQAIKIGDFCECTKDKHVSEFFEKDQWSRLVPRWTRPKCGGELPKIQNYSYF